MDRPSLNIQGFMLHGMGVMHAHETQLLSRDSSAALRRTIDNKPRKPAARAQARAEVDNNDENAALLEMDLEMIDVVDINDPTHLSFNNTLPVTSSFSNSSGKVGGERHAASLGTGISQMSHLQFAGLDDEEKGTEVDLGDFMEADDHNVDEGAVFDEQMTQPLPDEDADEIAAADLGIDVPADEEAADKEAENDVDEEPVRAGKRKKPTARTTNSTVMDNKIALSDKQIASILHDSIKTTINYEQRPTGHGTWFTGSVMPTVTHVLDTKNLRQTKEARERFIDVPMDLAPFTFADVMTFMALPEHLQETLYETFKTEVETLKKKRAGKGTKPAKKSKEVEEEPAQNDDIELPENNNQTPEMMMGDDMGDGLDGMDGLDGEDPFNVLGDDLASAPADHEPARPVPRGPARKPGQINTEELDTAHAIALLDKEQWAEFRTTSQPKTGNKKDAALAIEDDADEGNVDPVPKRIVKYVQTVLQPASNNKKADETNWTLFSDLARVDETKFDDRAGKKNAAKEAVRVQQGRTAVAQLFFSTLHMMRDGKVIGEMNADHQLMLQLPDAGVDLNE